MEEVSGVALVQSLRGQYHHGINFLLVGPERATEAALQQLSLLFGGPTETCVLPGPLQLPPAGCAALILRNVGALDGDQQEELSHWLEHGPRVSVVSMNPSSVFDLVANGEFDDRLYYRLNMVLEEAATT